MAGRTDRTFTNTQRRATCDCVLNVTIAVFTVLIVIETLVSAFLLPRWPPEPNNIFFASTIVLICVSHLIQICRYRGGEMMPSYRWIILYNAVTISLLCVCGNLYIHGIGVGYTCTKK